MGGGMNWARKETGIGKNEMRMDRRGRMRENRKEDK